MPAMMLQAVFLHIRYHVIVAGGAKMVVMLRLPAPIVYAYIISPRCRAALSLLLSFASLH